MTWKKLLPFALFILILTACAMNMDVAEEQASYGLAGYSEPAVPPALPSSAEAPMEDGAFAADAEYARFALTEGTTNFAANQPAQGGETPPQERLIIRTADLSIVVEDTETALNQITQMAEENGGWVVTSGVFQYNETAKTGHITVRVPSDGFNSAMEAIRRLALEVTNESSSGQDVTEEYVDLDARLQNLEATADRVRSFLDSATKVEDALAVNAELSRLEGEIEVIKGRMQYLSQSASFSTITVNITPDILSQPIEVGGWRPEGVARDAIEALAIAMQNVVSALIWIGLYVLPLAVLFGVPLWLVVRFVRRRWQRRPIATVTSNQ